jgi:hypothetical protein
MSCGGDILYLAKESGVVGMTSSVECKHLPVGMGAMGGMLLGGKESKHGNCSSKRTSGQLAGNRGKESGGGGDVDIWARGRGPNTGQAERYQGSCSAGGRHVVGFRVWRAFPTVGTQAAQRGIVIRWRLFPRQGVRAWMRGCVGAWCVVRGCVDAWMRAWVGAGQRGRARARLQVQSKRRAGEGHWIYRRRLKGQRGIQLPRHEMAS